MPNIKQPRNPCIGNFYTLNMWYALPKAHRYPSMWANEPQFYNSYLFYTCLGQCILKQLNLSQSTNRRSHVTKQDVLITKTQALLHTHTLQG